jgi:hypothetical protein
MRLEVVSEGTELDRPLGNPPHGISVVEYVTKQVVSHDGDRVLLEVVS